MNVLAHLATFTSKTKVTQVFQLLSQAFQILDLKLRFKLL